MNDPRFSAVIRESVDVLRKTAAERDNLSAQNESLRAKLAMVEQRLRSEKIAAEMHQKGINADIPFSDLVVQIDKQASEGQSLDILERAVEMSAFDMSKTATVGAPGTNGTSEQRLAGFLVS